MPPQLYACGSNGSSQLSIGRSEDVSVFTPCIFHPTVELGGNWHVIDLVSASTHSLLLLGTSAGNVLLGAGTNTLGQLGPRCALWDDVKPEARFKRMDFAKSAGLDGDCEPVKIATTWTSSFVVYQKRSTATDPAQIEENTSGGSSLRQTETHGAHGALEQCVIACGSNDFGELGESSGSLDKIAVTRPSDNAVIVNLNLLPGEEVDLIQGGQRHVIAVINGPNGQRVVGWGAARKGELDPSSYESTRPGSMSSSAKSKAKGKMSAYPTTLPPTILDLPKPEGTTVADIALGASHTLALLSDESLLAWGSDAKGQIGGLGGMSSVRSIAATWNGSYILLQTREMWSQGSNTHGQLLHGANASEPPLRAPIDLPRSVIVHDISAGSEHLLVLARSEYGGSDLWVGGWNEHGNLALGDQVDRHTLHKLDISGQMRVWGGLGCTWICIE